MPGLDRNFFLQNNVGIGDRLALFVLTSARRQLLRQLQFTFLQYWAQRARHIGGAIADQLWIGADRFYKNARRQQIPAIIQNVAAPWLQQHFLLRVLERFDPQFLMPHNLQIHQPIT